MLFFYHEVRNFSAAQNEHSIVRDRLEKLDWLAVSEDVSAFLEHPAERSLLTKRTLLAALERAEGGIE